MYSTIVISLLVFKETSASNECCTANVAMSNAFEDCQQSHASKQKCTDGMNNNFCQWIDCSQVGYCADSAFDKESKKANKKNKGGCAQFIEETLCNMFGSSCIWKEGIAPKQYTMKGGHYFDEHGAVILGEHFESNNLFALFADKYTAFIENSPWGFISFVSFIFTFSIFCMVATLICGCKRIKRYTEERLEDDQTEDVLPESTSLLDTTYGSQETVEGLAFCE